MADISTEELGRLFSQGQNASLEPDVVTELRSIMRLHSLTPQELFYKWESHCLKMGWMDQQLNFNTARSLKQSVQDNLERENRGKVQNRIEKRPVVTPRAMASSGDVMGMLDGLMPKTPNPSSARSYSSATRRTGSLNTPSTGRLKTEPASSPPIQQTANTNDQLGSSTATSTSFVDRQNPGQTLEVLNDHLPLAVPNHGYLEPRIKLTAGSDIKKLSYKPMAMKASEASEILDDRIDEFMSIVQDYYQFDDNAFGNPASQNTSDIVAVGRIASDSLDGKLNKASTVLESSRRMGAGWRISLNMGAIQNFQFFPGQIVAFRGTNASGHEFLVKEILQIPLLQVAASPPAILEAHAQRLRCGPNVMESDDVCQPLTVILAAGPYTADDNLDFEPLHELCSQAASISADALILTGPFLDIDHPLIASGDFDLPDESLPDSSTFATVFKHLISPIFHQLVASVPNITVLLVPSVRDATSSHVSWPQEPMPRKSLNLPKEVRMIGNPMTVSLNEAVFGISSQDILTELRQAETIGNKAKDSSLLVRLPKYLIEQRHFFPLYPPIDRTSLPRTGTMDGVATGAMLDTSYLKLGEIINTRPDILLIPSALTPFAKVVESVLVINPGFLSKRRAPGTYARVTIHTPTLTREETSQEKMVGHRVFERARVDIVKI